MNAKRRSSRQSLAAAVGSPRTAITLHPGEERDAYLRVLRDFLARAEA